MSTLVISSNVTSSGLTVSAGETIEVMSWGTVEAIVVNSGGTLDLSSNATVSGLMVSSGGIVSGPGVLLGDSNSDAGIISGLDLGSPYGADLTVLSGGVVINLIGDNGVLTVDAGGKVSGATTNSGAYFDIHGSAVGEMFAGGQQIIESGGVVSGAVLNANATETVVGGGVDDGSTVNSGRVVVWSGGLVSGDVVGSSGMLVLSQGATASAVTVNSGGVFEYEGPITVSSGQDISGQLADAIGGNTVVFSSAAQFGGASFLSGGELEVMAYGLTILNGGEVTLSSGQGLNNLTVSSGGSVVGPGEIFGGGVIGGLISGVTVTGTPPYPYSMHILSGGVADNVTVISGVVVVDGVFSGGVVTGDSSSGSLTVDAHGTFEGAVVESGGVVILSAGATVSGDTVSSGGLVELDVSVISSGQNLGGIQSGTVTLGGFTFLSGGEEEVVGATTVLSGGVLNIVPNQNTSGLTVSAGGEVVGPGQLTGNNYIAGVASGVLIEGLDFSDKGLLEVRAGGLASGVGVDAVAELVIDAGGTAVGTIVQTGTYFFEPLFSNGGQEIIDSGGVASGTQVDSGGWEIISSGGHSVSGVVSSGGTEILSAGGVISGDVIQSGGVLAVQAVISSGQTSLFPGQVLSSVNFNNTNVLGEQAAATTVVDGATLESGAILAIEAITVLSGGTLSLTSVQSASNVMVSAGGRVIGSGFVAGETAGIVSGVSVGNLEVLSGGVVSGVLGGNLQIDNGGIAVSANIDDITVDSGGVTSGDRVYGDEYVNSGGRTSGSVIAGGWEIVAAGGVTIGSIISGPNGLIQLNGGTADGALIVSEGQANVDSGGVMSGSTVGLGGTLILGSSGTLSAMTIASGGFEMVYSAGVVRGEIVSNGGYLFLNGDGQVLQNVTVSSGGGFFVYDEVASGQVYSAQAETAQTTISGVTLRVGADLDFYGQVDGGGTLSMASGTAAYFLTVDGTLSGPGALLGDNTDYGAVVGASVGNAAIYSVLTVQGGSVSNVDIVNGQIVLQYGGWASGVDIASGSELSVNSNDSVTGATVAGFLGDGGSATNIDLDGGTVEISSGSVLTNLSGFGTLEYGGGLTLSGSVFDNANIIYELGFATTALGGEVTSISTLLVGSAGTASGVAVAGDLIVSGTASNILLQGGEIVVASGAVVSGVTGSGTEAFGSGTALSGLTLNAPAIVFSAGSGATMDGGDLTSVSTLVVDAGAVVSGMTVAGEMIVEGLGSNTILAGGTVEVLNGGVLTGESGAGTVVFGGGSVVSGVTMNAGHIVFSAAAGAQLHGGDLSSVSTLVVGAGAVVSGLTVEGEAIVYGTASNTILDFGTLEEMGGGVLVGATGTGAIEYGGGLTLNGAVFNAGNVVYEIGPGGTMNAGSVSSVSTLVVEAGALVSGVTVAGEMIVSGVASNTILAGGALEEIGGGALIGASGNGTIIYGSGVVLSNAVMDGPAIVLEVGSGATFKASDITSVSTVVALAGVVASGITVEGELIVNGGAAIAGGLVLNGGEVLIAGSVGAGQTISFTASGGDLVDDNPSNFSASIAGMTGAGDKIDLGGFTYGSGETVSWTEAGGGTSGTLTVTDGAKTASLTLLGSYVTSNFSLSDDGIGGSFVVDHPSAGAGASTATATTTATASSAATGAGVASFTQAMSVFGQTSPAAAVGWGVQATNAEHGYVTSAFFIGPAMSGAG